MTTAHPSEEQLQQYALNDTTIADGMAEHIGSCSACRASVTAYATLFAALQQQPSPAVGFDIVEAALSALPLPAKKFRVAQYFVFVLLAGVAGVPLYLFKDNINNLFSGGSLFFSYSCAGSAFIFLWLRIAVLIKKYHKQFSLVNHSADLQPYPDNRV